MKRAIYKELRSKVRRPKNGLCVILAVLVGLWSSPAFAGSLLAPPPEKMLVAPGGVDMRSGRYAYNHTDLTIGGAGGLELTRTLGQQVVGHLNPMGSFSHSFDIMVSEKAINLNLGDFRHGTGPDYQIEVSFGGLSQTFTSPSTDGYGYDKASRSGYAILTYSAPSGQKWSPSTVYTFQASDGTQAIFRPMGSGDCSSTLRCAYVSQVTRPDGTKLDFTYENSGSTNTTRLRAVTSSRGYALLFEYSGMQVTKACLLNLASIVKPASNICPAGVPTGTYTYETVSGAQRLLSFADPAGAVWGFVNTANSMGFVKPGASSPWLTNQFQLRTNDDFLVQEIITSQSFADGQSYTYGYYESPPIPDHVPNLAGGTYTDAQGATTNIVYAFPQRPYSGEPSEPCITTPCAPYNVPNEVDNTIYQMTSGPVSVTDPLGRTTTYDYCDPNAMANLPPTMTNRCYVAPFAFSSVDPRGINTHYTWDFYTGNLHQSREVGLAGSSPAEIIRSANYNCGPATIKYCTKPTSTTDASGNVADYTYDSAHGGVLTETQPAVNGVRPQRRYSYAQRYAWISNGSGGYSQSAAPAWLLVSESFCRTSAWNGSACSVAGDEVVTTYDYGPNSGPNNLWLRGAVVTADGQSRRTCFTYDSLGRKISETTPNANLTSCP